MNFNAAAAFASPKHQNFSLPSSIVYYINKKPIISISYVWNPKSKWDGLPPKKEFQVEIFFNQSYKIWVTSRFIITGEVNIPKLFLKFYRFEAYNLHIYYQTFTFNELLLFKASPNINEIMFYSVNINYSNGSTVCIEKIIELWPKLKHFTNFGLNQSIVSSNTVKVLIENAYFHNIQHFFLDPISEEFDFVSFSDFMKEKKKIAFFLRFPNDISENYKTLLRSFTEWAINLATLDNSYCPPVIQCDGVDVSISTEFFIKRNGYL